MKVKEWIDLFETFEKLGANEESDICLLSSSGLPWIIQKDSVGDISFTQDKEKNKFTIRIK